MPWNAGTASPLYLVAFRSWRAVLVVSAGLRTERASAVTDTKPAGTLRAVFTLLTISASGFITPAWRGQTDGENLAIPPAYLLTCPAFGTSAPTLASAERASVFPAGTEETLWTSSNTVTAGIANSATTGLFLIYAAAPDTALALRTVRVSLAVGLRSRWVERANALYIVRIQGRRPVASKVRRVHSRALKRAMIQT